MRRAVDLLAATSVAVIVVGWWWFESSAPSDADRDLPALVTGVVVVFTAPAVYGAHRHSASNRHLALAVAGQLIAIGFFRLLEPSWPAAVGALAWFGGAVVLVTVADEIVQRKGTAWSPALWACSSFLAAVWVMVSAAGGPGSVDGTRSASWSWIEWVPSSEGGDGTSVRRWQENPFGLDWVSSNVTVVVWVAWSGLLITASMSSLIGVFRERGPRWSLAHLAALLAIVAHVVAAWPEQLDVAFDDSTVRAGWYADLMIAVPALVAVGLGMVAAWQELIRPRIILVGDEVIRLTDDSSPAAVRRELGSTLGDPTVRLLFADTQSNELRWFDEAGDTSALAADPHRAAVVLAHAGRPTAAVEHDISLALQPDLVDLAATSASLALERRRLAALAERDAADARASATRLLVAEEESRAVLRERVAEGPGRRLERARSMLRRSEPDFGSVHDEVRAGVAEIRALARAEQPPSLRQHGLATALSDLAGDTGTIIDVGVPVDRLAPSDELTLYLVLEEFARAAATGGRRRVVGHVAVRPRGIELVVAEPDTQLSAVVLDRIDTLGGLVRADGAGATFLLPDARTEIFVSGHAHE